VHSKTLRNSSGLFNTIFSLPQPLKGEGLSTTGRENKNEPAEIPTYESDSVLVPLLRLLYSLPLPGWDSYDAIEQLLFVAEKWDTPRLITFFRGVLMASPFLKHNPLRLYAIAKHFGWEEEAKIATTLTLGLDLRDEVYKETLERLTTKELMPLMRLRIIRTERFKELLDSPQLFAAGNR
jgi:hypothetical protein